MQIGIKNAKKTPLLPISTGTNNVFPNQIEGTVAGIVAGKFCLMKHKEKFISQEQKLDVFINNLFRDSALVDVVASEMPYVGSKAIWDLHQINEIFISKFRPTGIGFSSLGFYSKKIKNLRGKAIHLVLKPSTKNQNVIMEIDAPIAPGKIENVSVYQTDLFDEKIKKDIYLKSGTIALDGERSIEFSPSDKVSVQLNVKGPRILLVEKILSNQK